MKIRRPAQAGAFYPATRESLSSEIERCFLHKLGPGTLARPNPQGERKLVGLVCPHAGYEYSGPIAAHSYLALAKDGIPKSVIILGPNHYGIGSGISMMTEGAWQTPLGEVSIDNEIAQRILDHSDIIDMDETGHAREHSIEVQLPFLQYLYGSEIKIVPISMIMQDLETSRDVGHAIGNAVDGMNIVIVASSDMTHYEPHQAAEQKDRKVADAITHLDEEGLQQTVEENNISMCGYGPVSTTIVAAKQLGANNAKVVAYRTSGDMTGDYGQVVGYLSALISR
ncbi:MAG: AmmeMemoRadiSam system protein B [archaeon]